MTRHSRNATANPCYTYHERKKDSTESGYGSKTMRLTKDAVRPADCCCLTLQPAKEPVVTSEGFLYDRAAIIEYMVQQKETNALKLKQWKARRKQLENVEKSKLQQEKQRQTERFAASERHVVSLPASASASSGKQVSTSANFWVPGLGKKPEEDLSGLPPRPDETVRCPMSGKPLKLKDLIPINFKRTRKDGEKGASSFPTIESGDYECALTGDTLSNSQQLAVMRPSGAVVLQSAADQILKFDAKHAEQVMDPIANKPLECVITLKRGGSGFTAAVGEDLSQIQATLNRPALAFA